MQFIFWFSVATIAYTYIGYPIILYILSLFRRKVVLRDKHYSPHVSLIIAVHNEQDRVQEKIDNTLALDYPQDRLEIIFASDASTDKTEYIVQSYKRFKLVRAPERRGKEFAQKCAVDQSSGEILVFSDVATILEPAGLRTIISNFADPTIGCVSSEDCFIDKQGQISGEGAYVKYEMLLRRLESNVYSVVGLSGSFFAARRKVCADWAVDLQSDFNTLLNSLKLGLRGISDPLSFGYYRNISDEKKEFNRKVRTVVRGISVLMRNLAALNPFQYGLFSWELLSHKVCRWIVPFMLVLCFFSNTAMAFKSANYLLLLISQILFYMLAYTYYKFIISSINSESDGLQGFMIYLLNRSFFKIPFFFVSVNIAICVAWWKYIRGNRLMFWEPSKR